MTALSVVQIIVFFGLLLLLTRPLGGYMARVFAGERTVLHPVLGGLERGTYRLLGVDPAQDMKWTNYASALLVFSLVSMLFIYAVLRLQGLLPLNPQGYGADRMPADLAFNTAASFMSNTNWQSYSPEQTLSYFSNMVGLAINNWASAAVGMAVAIAVTRGFARRSADGLGNFWADVVRGTLHVLLPLALLGALVYVAMGVPQNFDPATVATTLEGGQQTIWQGPVASQEIIKQLGTNGGGFFNANSAHPFENPSPASNFFTLLLIWSLPAAITHTFGKMVGNPKQGWALFGAMAALALAGAFLCTAAEQAGTPHLAAAHIETSATDVQAGGNMEGKEVRFGIAGSALFAVVTTGASCGAVNSMHDSYTPLGGLVPLFNMLTGESAPVIRESGGDRSAVTGGTRVLSDRIVVRVTQERGQSFLDRMIALVEGAKRQKTPNEIALSILLSGLTIIFLLATVTLLPFARYAAGESGGVPTVTVLVALLVCLIPTTIGGLLSAIGIAGMDRVMQHNVLAMSGKAVEAAGDVNTLLLDKTGTITLGNRQATLFHPARNVAIEELARAAQLGSQADETPEGRSIVALAKEKYGVPAQALAELGDPKFIEFSAQTRMSGVDVGQRHIRKGAADAVKRFVESNGGVWPADIQAIVEGIAREGGTPLVVADGVWALGVGCSSKTSSRAG